jgi:hypothetical protein
MMGVVEPLEFNCPRCGVTARAVYYGPCPDCRDGLRASQRAEARAAEAPAWEPKMNVVPNQVATKE